MFERELRNAIADSSKARADGRAAGTGLWTNYVRAVGLTEANWPIAYPEVADFAKAHKELINKLETIAPLTKDEKNGLNSARSIIKGAVQERKELFRRDDSGNYVEGEDGYKVPRGKTDLQNDKSLFEKLGKLITTMDGMLKADNREPLSAEELEKLCTSMALVLQSLNNEREAAIQPF